SGPPATASRKLDGSTPSPSANANVSAIPSTTATSQAFVTSFRRVPAPASPSHSVFLPTVSKIGSQLSRASSGPEASTTSSPASAGALVPSTGASTKLTPASAASDAQRSVAATPI